ncbi:hypothetical protein FACS1894216_19690 [Synergistales bacterium]|nr:hypothetical protein FACS1894216_19690 [Synergistales bacterium]
MGGYYVNAKYIDQQGDSLRDEFTFSVCMSPENRDVLSVIEAEQNSVALHIRRGDFVGSVHDVTTPKYFRDAVKLVADKLSPAKGVFFVFSNGLDWSREILSEIDQKCIFVDNNNNDNGAIDMFLMSKCSHFIISNSSFSWWPAWLSRRTPGKTVVMPNIWLAGESAGNRHSMRNDGWIELPVI